ncbi:HU family DNA-binding protein [Spirosoma endophyticum]|uniref:DNA-binding protein HU-beta n=1 Tax=Spirosoma endophyticum TaxID=662367 RepID=A0A1I2GRC4_9BACT|nr:HU family DNA-binding protein [Spirosoma endophyticum]SFF19206.1 DNA-binding protein HU-beta [Spirosoma endophyticum]
MTKQDVLRRVSKQTGIDPQISLSIMESFFEVVKGAVSEGETIYIRRFGSFGLKQRARKIGRNISANTALVIEAHSIPGFKPSAEFINQVRSSKADRK